MQEALAAYDAAFTETGVPAAGIFAAGQVLGLPPADTLNLLLREGHVSIVWYRRPENRNPVFWRFERT